MGNLLAYLNANGILLCNSNPYLPALADIGCTWSDVTALIDHHALFYCKAFKKRTTYLSKEAYYLLKSLKKPKPLPPSAEAIYRLLEVNPPAETTFLKQVSLLPSKEYGKGFDFLLQNLYITALQNGTALNENWSTFCYGTAKTWEQYVPNRYHCDEARERLWELVSHVMSEKDFKNLIR